MNTGKMNTVKPISLMLLFGLFSVPASGGILITDIGSDTIFRANNDGSNVQTVTTTAGNPVNAIIQNDQLYWSENLVPAIQRSNADGTGKTTLWTGVPRVDTAENLAIDSLGRKLYWTDDLNDEIRTSNLDGSNVQTLIDVGPDNPFDIALDLGAGKMYWTESSGINIRRADLDGTNQELLVNTTGPVGTFLGLALDLVNGKMYWTHRQSESIQRANLDGSLVETIVTGRDTPRGSAWTHMKDLYSGRKEGEVIRSFGQVSTAPIPMRSSRDYRTLGAWS